MKFSKHTASFKIGVSKNQDFGNFELSAMLLTLIWVHIVYNTLYMLPDEKMREQTTIVLNGGKRVQEKNWQILCELKI